jgi:hypothetical protein
MDRSPIIRLISAAVAAGSLAAASAFAYPPAVGILSKSRSCLSCHVSNGPWSDEARTVIDVIDAKTKKSLQVPDGTFQIDVPRGEARTVLTVIGRRSGDAEVPRRNAWLYLDPTRIDASTLSKFPPGWDVNLPMACRIVGDKLEGYEGDHLTALPMTIRPTDAAGDAEIELQVMLTAGEAVKGQGKEGMVGNYFTRKVILKVVD